MEHALRTTGIINARQLGGYMILGKRIKDDRLLRTASLARLLPKDKEILESYYRVGIVCDFRMSIEREQMKDPELSGASNVFLSIMEAEDFPDADPEMLKIVADPNTDRMVLLKNAMDMGMLSESLYVDFLLSERGKASYRKFFECLLELPEDKAILWHCTDGKDRTGVASMLLLAALGADRELILTDYLLTNRFNEKRLSAVKASLEKSPMSPEMKEVALFGAGAVFEKYMTNALDALNEKYGSPMGYIAKELRIGDSERADLCRKYLEE